MTQYLVNETLHWSIPCQHFCPPMFPAEWKPVSRCAQVINFSGILTGTFKDGRISYTLFIHWSFARVLLFCHTALMALFIPRFSSTPGEWKCLKSCIGTVFSWSSDFLTLSLWCGAFWEADAFPVFHVLTFQIPHLYCCPVCCYMNRHVSYCVR